MTGLPPSVMCPNISPPRTTIGQHHERKIMTMPVFMDLFTIPPDQIDPDRRRVIAGSVVLSSTADRVSSFALPRSAHEHQKHSRGQWRPPRSDQLLDTLASAWAIRTPTPGFVSTLRLPREKQR